ncbi:uncharacterized protein LTR77_002258 [Saxophila tyrrhenica]|uniref:Uncharacterized protein n=1 Tax=Saxophila tyrrhenica TaxID=1690608 RepID=A0AAV9PKS0_9PEZI|nr:hypothetical protein LTR77_002258 [Saxophila tyrrhenica]
MGRAWLRGIETYAGKPEFRQARSQFMVCKLDDQVTAIFSDRREETSVHGLSMMTTMPHSGFERPTRSPPPTSLIWPPLKYETIAQPLHTSFYALSAREMQHETSHHEESRDAVFDLVDPQHEGSHDNWSHKGESHCENPHHEESNTATTSHHVHVQNEEMQEEELQRADSRSGRADEADGEQDSDSDSSTPEPEPQEVTVDGAIDTAPLFNARVCLMNLAHTFPEAHNLIKEYLTLPIPGSDDKRQKAFEYCGHCGSDYPVAQNEVGECCYHDGKLEQKPYADAVIRSQLIWSDAAYRRGFRTHLVDDKKYWTCCQQEASETGCIEDKHTPESQCEEKHVRTCAEGCVNFECPMAVKKA